MKVVNLTRYQAEAALLSDADGGDVLVVIVKAGFCASSGAVSREPCIIQKADEFATNGALEEPSDFATERTGTSVIVRGAIVAADEHARSASAHVIVGPLEKRLAAFGPRGWARDGGTWKIVERGLYEPVEARFEHAFGGACGDETYEQNPVGRGFFVADQGLSAEDVALPLVEDAAQLLVGPEDRPPPAALWPVAPGWLPRRALAGTYDEAWKRTRAPLPAVDLDLRFHDVGAAGLVARPRLRGGEPVVLENVGRLGRFELTLPRPIPRIVIENHLFVPELDRVVIDGARDAISLTFRTSVPISLARPPMFPILVRELSEIERGASA